MSSGLTVQGAKQGIDQTQKILADFSNPFLMVDRTKSAHEQAIELTFGSNIKMPAYSLGHIDGVARFVDNQYGFTLDYRMLGVYNAGNLPAPIASLMGSNYSSASALQNAIVNNIATANDMSFQQWISWSDPVTPFSTNGSFTAYSDSGNGEFYAPFFLKSIALNSQRPLFWDYGMVTISSLASGSNAVPANNLVINDELMIAPNDGDWFGNPPPAATLEVIQTKHTDGNYYADIYLEVFPTLNIAYNGDFTWWGTTGSKIPTQDQINQFTPRTIVQPNIAGTIIDLYLRAFSNDTRNSYKIPGKTD